MRKANERDGDQMVTFDEKREEVSVFRQTTRSVGVAPIRNSSTMALSQTCMGCNWSSHVAAATEFAGGGPSQHDFSDLKRKRHEIFQRDDIFACCRHPHYYWLLYCISETTGADLDLHWERPVVFGGFAGKNWLTVRQKEVNEYSDQDLRRILCKGSCAKMRAKKQLYSIVGVIVRAEDLFGAKLR